MSEHGFVLVAAFGSHPMPLTGHSPPKRNVCVMSVQPSIGDMIASSSQQNMAPTKGRSAGAKLCLRTHALLF